MTDGEAYCSPTRRRSAAPARRIEGWIPYRPVFDVVA